ncbi:MAG: ATP-binding protein [Firmicutes bacterium]|nr:ATP-binding protein [Bacillota bacterium]
MKNKIFLRFIGIIAVTLLSCGLITAVIFGIKAETETTDYLTNLALDAASSYVNTGDMSLIYSLIDVDRVTLIDESGAVIWDSDARPNEMENHSQREEVKNAEEGKVFISKRQSQTLSMPFLYAATRLPDGSVLRLAKYYQGLLQSIQLVTPAIVVSVLITLVLAVLLARSFADDVVKPLEYTAEKIAIGDFSQLPQTSIGYYEIDRIILNIKRLLQEITKSKEELQLERDKIQFILANMAEGFVLLDANKNIVLINDSAKNIFKWDKEETPEKVYLLTRNIKINDALEKAGIQNISSIFDLEIESKTFSVHISPVIQEAYLANTGKGITMLLIDVTTERDTQKMRSQFFSNASHELQTPITSILGFTEMLDNDMLTEEKRKETYKRIQNETRRIANLINDILTISRLESNEVPKEDETVSFNEVVSEVISALTPQAITNNITVNVNCGTIRYKASRRQIYELIKNLVENALKYNRAGGVVDISVFSTANNVVIEVADTGIGIPMKAQSRIFERFYRVDSGRTKTIGGTGLGLAIVKHITLNLRGEILLESKENVGTKITVKLPYTKFS